MDKLKKQSTMWNALSLAFELGYIIALPLVFAGVGGRFLDNRYNTSPLFILVGITLAVIITSVWLVFKLKDFMKE